MKAKKLNAALVLSDGSVFQGEGFGAQTESSGELVFNTSMTGYQEALTDPSYAGQILLMSYPLIGNYGISPSFFESPKIHARGFCVRMASPDYSHSQSSESLSKFLEGQGIPGISGIDTRSIVRRIREKGVVPAAIAVNEGRLDLDSLLSSAKKVDYSHTDFVRQVTTKNPYDVGQGRKKVVLIDGGAKGGIAKELSQRGLKVIVMPAFSTEKEIRSYEPDGIAVSNGPGDPALLSEISNTLKKLFDLPIFGVCLGHQLLGQAAGAKTYKLKFGHRGANQPVLEKKTGKVSITSQNHGYAVDPKGLPEEFEETHTNLNDGTNEGLAHKRLPIFSVQYHPEARPGPWDSKGLFDKFISSLGGD